MKNRQGKLKTAGKQGLAHQWQFVCLCRKQSYQVYRPGWKGRLILLCENQRTEKSKRWKNIFFVYNSKDRNALNKHRNKEYSNLSLDKKMSADTPSFTESDELVGKTNHGRTNSLREAVVLSKIDEENLNLDTKSDDTSVQSTDRIEIPYDGSPQVTVDTINKYLDGLRTKDDQQE